MSDFWQQTVNKLRQGQQAVLLLVVESHGSSPGKQGFKMAVFESGDLLGSVGGGVMEHRLVERARKMLKTGHHKPELSHENHHPEAKQNRSGMICSGRQTVLLQPLGKQELPLLEKIVSCTASNTPAVLEISNEKFAVHESLRLPGDESGFRQPDENLWSYHEQLALPDRLFIFGAGHVGLALSRLFSMLDFRVTVFDNRPGLDTFEENTFASHKQIVDFDRIEDLIPEGDNIYVAIMTFGHANDEVVLKQLLKKNLRYLGMMGSRMKVDTIFGNLRRSGFTDADLNKVDAPIGLRIGSETPEEIAVSIAAKIIAVRRSVTKS